MEERTMAEIGLARAAEVQGRITAECMALESLLARCPETLRPDLETLLAPRQKALDAMRAAVEAVTVAVPAEAERYVPPEEPVAPVEPVREG